MNRYPIACLLAALLLPAPLRADPGLAARYSDGKQTIQTAVNSPAFTLADNESVHPQVGPAFNATYDGSLKILRRAKYTFTADGATLMLDGKPVSGAIELD